MKRAKQLTFANLPRRTIPVDGKQVHVVEALGSCGFGTSSKVEVAHIHGVALFVFDGPAVPANVAPFYTCVAAGLPSCTGSSREEALVEGVRQARKAQLDGVQHISFAELQAMALTPNSAAPLEASYAAHH
jgi:hypothetical protein